MQERTFRRWAVLSLVNLFVLSGVGLLLRYKIILPLPAVDHKNLLHGHSHFAFSGWVSMALFTAMAWVLFREAGVAMDRYRRILLLGHVSAYGMLLTFTFFGYRWPSISFAVLLVVVTYFFSLRILTDIRRSSLPPSVAAWFKAAVLFLVISSFGTFFLAYLMSSGMHTQELYIGSVYFFLHFQYNGWFFFAIMGLYAHACSSPGRAAISMSDRHAFRLFFLAAFPAYFLSALWMPLPSWIYWLGAAASVMQLAAFALLLKTVPRTLSGIVGIDPVHVRWLWGGALVALTLKVLMQAASVIPAVSVYAFGYRPIVVGYLHMVLLGFVSFSLVGYFLQQGLLSAKGRLTSTGLTLFIAGVVFNEILLLIQGIGSIRYESVRYVPQLLFFATAVIFTGLALFLSGQSMCRKGK